ncbi:hypothetical protein [Streptomyces sp. NBC_01264]|uniref:hypothetical protein n=1 Tax=Streptomyces sp. NBC_01264 TaxID=2903804 RepID=UPI002250E7C6|nr:hypothetical protein [Streptomyces sp. NBC_01264]MCX4779253.1 hypothetical protein [Streptomyces sp. NBC_01264]
MDIEVVAGGVIAWLAGQHDPRSAQAARYMLFSQYFDCQGFLRVGDQTAWAHVEVTLGQLALDCQGGKRITQLGGTFVEPALTPVHCGSMTVD